MVPSNYSDGSNTSPQHKTKKSKKKAIKLDEDG